MIQRFFLLLGLCYALTSARAAVPALEREVNLILNKEPAGSALQKIQEQTGLIFSYSSGVLSQLEPVTLTLRRKTVREALALILPRSVTYKTRNNYIILKERPVERAAKKTEVSGYVIDRTTEKKIANVTVYDKNTMQSATTNEYGFYSITVPADNKSLTVNRANYEDTVIVTEGLKDAPITTIALSPLTDSVRIRDSVNWRSRMREFSNYTSRLFKNVGGYIATINIRDTLTHPFQISFLPYFGTNHHLSGTVVNRVSLNIIGGYARGVSGFEAGGVFNVDKESVKGVQLAGVFNLVGDSMKGTQAAGFFNVNGGATQGVQAAGFFNTNLGNVEGVNMAGFMNMNRRKTNGAMLAGFMNIAADSMSGLQGAGFMNVAERSKGLQGAGFMNIAKSIRGAQAAGYINVADSCTGLQAAGFMNLARDMKGTQVAGFFNRAKRLDGVQVGFINVADSCRGVPIGFFSFVRSGVHQLEMHSDEVFYSNLGFRTGVPAFYTVFSAGLRPNGNDPLWSFGYAVGTSFRIAQRLRSDITLGTQHVSLGAFTDANSDLYKLYWGLEYKVARKFTIAAGPTFNVYHSDNDLPGYSANTVAPYTLFDQALSNNSSTLKGWVGGRVALRFF